MVDAEIGRSVVAITRGSDPGSTPVVCNRPGSTSDTYRYHHI